jgi:hypothetical protein
VLAGHQPAASDLRLPPLARHLFSNDVKKERVRR